MRTAAKVGLSFGAIFGAVVLFTVVAPEQTHSVVKALSLDKTAAKWQYHHGFMGKENSAWKDVDWETVNRARFMTGCWYRLLGSANFGELVLGCIEAK